MSPVGFPRRLRNTVKMQVGVSSVLTCRLSPAQLEELIAINDIDPADVSDDYYEYGDYGEVD